jgi:hypothetical protein
VLDLGTVKGLSHEWRHNCPVHGTQSEWYAREGKAKLIARSQKAVEMQFAAAAARAKALEKGGEEP